MVVQVALALVLLICSGLMIRTFQALMHVSPGFDAPDSVQTFRFYIPETQIPTASASACADGAGHSRQAGGAFPAYPRSSFSSAVPMDGYDSNDLLYAQDHMYERGRTSADPPLQIHLAGLLRDAWARS